MQVDLNVPAAYVGQMPSDVLGPILASLPRGSAPLGSTRLGAAVSVDENLVAALLPLGFTVITYNQGETANNDGFPAPDTNFG
jgi:hypothetical protein